MSNLNEKDIAKIEGIILPEVGNVKFDKTWYEYTGEEHGWLPIPAADVPLDDLLLCYEDLIIELSLKETEYLKLKEDYDSKEFEIVFMSDINFKELYGSTSEKVRKQHASNELKPLKDELQGLELSIDYLKRYIVFIRELCKWKRTVKERD